MKHEDAWKREWKATNYGEQGNDWDVTDGKGRVIATCYGWEDDGRSNARLLAAAPALLAALDFIADLAELTGGATMNHIAKKARAAIAKASKEADL